MGRKRANRPQLRDYWQAIARGIEAEDQKLCHFVNQSNSLGIAREAILRQLLIDQTVEPFKVSTGFIHGLWNDGELHASEQCDVLVYNPTIYQPKYMLNEFVVVPSEAATLAVEVKSNLEQEDFDGILQKWESTRSFALSVLGIGPVPTFGFAFEGVTFKTFVKYLSEAIKNDIFRLPEVIAVHQRNYIGFRANNWDDPRTGPEVYLVADLSRADENVTGLATSCFLQFYDRRLRDFTRLNMQIHPWFNDLPLPDRAKVRINPDGKVENGPIP